MNALLLGSDTLSDLNLREFVGLIVVFDYQRYVQHRLFHVSRNPGSDPFLIFDGNGLVGMLCASV